MIKYRGWIFHKFPPKLKKSDYADVMSHFKGSDAYYIDSSIKYMNPGFSDIDFLVLGGDPSRFLIKNMKSKMRDVTYHDGLYLSPQLFAEYKKLCMMPNTRIKSFDDGSIIKGNTSDLQLKFYNWDDLLMHHIRNILNPYFTKTIDVRGLTHKLKSLRFLYGKNRPKKIDLLLSHIYDIRENWFSRTERQSLTLLISALEEAVTILNSTLIDYCNGFKQYCKTINGSYMLADPDYPVLFTDSDDYIKLSEKIYREHSLVVPVFPPHMMALFLEYRKGTGPISSYLKKMLPNKAALNKRYNKAAKQRIDFYNEMSRFVRSKGLGYGPIVHFNLHFRRGLRTRVRLRQKVNKLKSIADSFSA